MPTWICPTCMAKMTVKDSHVGNPAPCVTCGTVSTVFDVEAIAAMVSPTAPAFVPPASTAVSGTTINRIRSESPWMVAIWKIGHMISVVICSLIGIYLVTRTKSEFWYILPIMSFISLAAWWPVYEFMSDVYRCRRLLEEIAKK